MSAISQAPGADSDNGTGRALVSEMKLTSATTAPTGSGIRLRSSRRASRRSSETTRGFAARRPSQLAVADIDRVDARCAPREQDLREAAGRGADIEGDNTLHHEPEVVEGCRELQGAARDICRNTVGEGNGLTLGNPSCSLGGNDPADHDTAARDQVTRL